MSANPDTAAPTGRKKPSQGKERSDAALGHESQNTSSPVGAKQGGEYPAGWRRATLGEILPLKYGKARTEQFGYPRPDTQTFGSNGAFGTYYRALTNNPTLVVGRKGAAGAVHYSSEPCWPIDTAFYTEGSEGAFLAFFRYLLESLQLVRLDRSTAIPSLSRDDYSARVVHFPESLSEQRRIVAEIEKQFTRLEAGVAALRRVQANLKRYRAAVLKAACEGRLVPTEAALARSPRTTKNGPPAYETGEALLARILTERRQNWLARRSLGEGGQGRGQYKEPAAPDTENLAPIPDGWTWSALAQIATHITDGTHKTPTYVDSGVPFLSAKDISGFRLSFDKCRYISQSEHEEMSKRCDVRRGNVLITKSGTIGRVAVVETDDEFSLFESVANVPVLPPIEPKFISIAVFVGIAGAFGAANQKGVAVRHLHLEDLRRVPIPLPPLAEQTRIVAEVERRLSVVEELESVVTANLQRASSLRQSILQKAFTGELT